MKILVFLPVHNMGGELIDTGWLTSRGNKRSDKIM